MCVLLSAFLFCFGLLVFFGSLRRGRRKFFSWNLGILELVVYRFIALGLGHEANLKP